MAGGTYYSQNKKRPGAYINFKTSDEEIDINSSRGIVAVALPLDWGAENTLINLYASDLASDKSLAKVGLVTSDSNAKILNLILTNASLAKVFRLNYGGIQAKITTGNLTVTAKYSGTFGNKIAILITKNSNDVYTVTTYADGYEVDVQRVTDISGLEDNDFVTFSGTGALAEISSSVLLAGGTNGTVAAATAYEACFELLKEAKWQVIPICNNDEAINPLMESFIKEMRDDEGKYVQAVVANYSSADYEGIINNVNGAIINDTEVSAVEFTAYVAGITAQATMTESNTGKVIDGATQIIDQLDNDEIIAGLQNGKFILSTNQNGEIKVEQDINSLHNYDDDKNYAFTKNKVIRVLDTIASEIQSIWETSYLGKVANNENGRNLFKSSIVSYLNEVQEDGAIQDFEGAEDITVGAGDSIDSIEAYIKVKPVDAMEFLYLTINVME